MADFPFDRVRKNWMHADAIPRAEGIYAIFLDSVDAVPEEWRPYLMRDDGLLYIGKAKMGKAKTGLLRRLKGHFCGSSSASSTFRRSVGAMMWAGDTMSRVDAIMQRKLLLGRCLRTGGAKHFRFENEKPLSNWIQENCEFVFWESSDAYSKESDFIRELTPPFNIQIEIGEPNPGVHPLLQAALEKCEEESRRG